jgi:hypothetical protein
MPGFESIAPDKLARLIGTPKAPIIIDVRESDLAQIDAGMLLYDSLYRWARDAAEETHNWLSSKGSK